MKDINDTIEGFFCPKRILVDENQKVADKETNVKTDESDSTLFDWVAPYYDEIHTALDPIKFQGHSIILDILGFLDPEPASLIDLGCGTGLLALQVLELFPDSHIFGIDASMPMLEKARGNLAEFNGHFTLAKSDFRDQWEEIIKNPVDAVIHYKSLHHLPEHDLREMYIRILNILKPGGWFISAMSVDNGFPETVSEIGSLIWERNKASVRDDLSRHKKLFRELDKIREMKIEKGIHQCHLVKPEQHISWMMSAGFEYAVNVVREWGMAIFIARKPD